MKDIAEGLHTATLRIRHTPLALSLGLAFEEGRKTLQQPPCPLSHRHRRLAEMVRPVRIRIAGGLLALPWENGNGGFSLSGLW
jgi:hypothetical protein